MLREIPIIEKKYKIEEINISDEYKKILNKILQKKHTMFEYMDIFGLEDDKKLLPNIVECIEKIQIDTNNRADISIEKKKEIAAYIRSELKRVTYHNLPVQQTAVSIGVRDKNNEVKMVPVSEELKKLALVYLHDKNDYPCKRTVENIVKDVITGNLNMEEVLTIYSKYPTEKKDEIIKNSTKNRISVATGIWRVSNEIIIPSKEEESNNNIAKKR